MRRPRNPRGRISARRTALAATATLVLAVCAPAASNGARAGPPAARAPALPGSATPDDGLSCTLAPGPDTRMSEGMPTAPGYSRSTGTVHALTLMIDFPDTPGEGTARQRFAEFFPRTAQWFARGSYGRLDYRPAAPVDRWLRMPHTFRSYGIERGSTFEPGYRKLLRDIARAADPLVDFRRYDLVNVLITPNAGPPAAHTVLSVTFAGNREAPRADGVPLANVSFIYSRQDDGTGSFAANGYRVLPHENGHTFGLPDLYTAQGADHAGHWDVMSEDWGAGNDVFAWHKWKLGWLTEDQVECAARPGDSTYAISPLGRPGGGTKLVFVPASDSAGYAIEVRTNEGNDEGVCRPGVLISRLDTRADSGEGPITVMDATPDSGGCTRQPNVHPELSDAAYRSGGHLDDREHGLRITVTGQDAGGGYRVKVTRSA
ncbi:M6 family metalloprotease domain-containing protein [Streptomyces sp. XD-27]|uniref:M6 family metalloprotease domain-containing protein n=1 Tax=Streptomyces sp. XD-27 TaxID=3062779 RepID=UPI0026F458F0|nr:M6 family metalloprotease domain-containing protein [Streptomyces sp. XD-27]WKX74388.1 M6 family metalloprotease domain-containing protein [Streptomyces sp. XD-27]